MKLVMCYRRKIIIFGVAKASCTILPPTVVQLSFFKTLNKRERGFISNHVHTLLLVQEVLPSLWEAQQDVVYC